MAHDDRHPPVFPDPPGQDARDILRLAGKARAGDDAALEALVRHSDSILRRLLRIRTGLPPSALASLDLVRDLVLFAPPFQPAPRTAPGVLLWLCDLLQERIRAQAGVGPPAGPEPSARGAVSESDPIAELDRCVARLERRERDVILLRDYLEASWEETCHELDLSPERARALHARARLRLARELGQCPGRKP